MDIKEVLLLWFIIISLIKSPAGSGFKPVIKQNEELAEELHKASTKKFRKR